MTAPLRLLMTADAVGGVWQYATDLAAALRPRGIETTVALLGPPPDAAQRAVAEALGIDLIETGLPLDWLARDEAAVRGAARALAGIVAAGGYHAVQINQPALAAEPMPVPVVTVVHSCVATWWAALESGPLPADLAWQTALVRAGFARAAAIVCPSAAFAAAVAATYVLPHPPPVVHNGRRAVGGATLPMRDAVFTAGRLWDSGKDIATIDRAAAMLSVPVEAAGPLVGPHGEQARLDHAVALGGLSEAALAERLAARPVFVSAARYEPFGLAVLEAAQAGCALVLADTPTFRELWDGAAAFVAPGDAHGFASAVEAMIADRDARIASGNAARERASRFTPDSMAEGMAAILHSVLERRAAA